MSESFSKELVSRYAKALFDLAKEQGALDQTEKELLTIGNLLAQSGDTVRMIHNPLLSRTTQAGAIDAVVQKMGVSPLTQKFCKVLAYNRRLSLLAVVIETFLSLLSEERGEVTAEVISAVPLQDKQVTALKASLKDALHHEVRLKTTVDASILGGLIVKIGSRMLDNSIANKLERLRALSINAVSTL